MALALPPALSSLPLPFCRIAWGRGRLQMFSGIFSGVEGDAGRLNFDDISSALLTLFIITTGENWNTIMFDTMKYSGEPFWGSVYIISWYLFSNLGLVNLFVAVILGNFEEDDDVKAAYQERKYKALVMVSQAP